jgi:hypothetical protein
LSVALGGDVMRTGPIALSNFPSALRSLVVRGAVVLAALFLLLPTPVPASSVKLAAYLADYSPRQAPSEALDGIPCGSETESAALRGNVGETYFLYIVALGGGAADLRAIAFGVDYPGPGNGGTVEIVRWESFAGSQVLRDGPEGAKWPGVGSSVLLTLDAQSRRGMLIGAGEGLILGRFTVRATGPGTVRIVGVTPKGQVEALSSSERGRKLLPEEALGWVGFALDGYDPCSSLYLGAQSARSQAAAIVPTLPFAVSQASPNPSVGSAQWRITSDRERRVDIGIYSVAGRLVREWPRLTLHPGTALFTWDGLSSSGTRVAGGIYFLRLKSDGGEVFVREVVLIPGS